MKFGMLVNGLEENHRSIDELKQTKKKWDTLVPVRKLASARPAGASALANRCSGLPAWAHSTLGTGAPVMGSG